MHGDLNKLNFDSYSACSVRGDGNPNKLILDMFRMVPESRLSVKIYPSASKHGGDLDK
jgi:hypothetical protein